MPVEAHQGLRVSELRTRCTLSPTSSRVPLEINESQFLQNPQQRLGIPQSSALCETMNKKKGSVKPGMEISRIDVGSEMVVEEAVAGEVGGELQPKMGSAAVPPRNGLVEKNAHVAETEIESLRNEAAGMVITTPTQGVAEAGRPLSTWFGGLCSYKSGGGLSDSEGRQVVEPANNHDDWPFVKRSPAWGSIESMEVFRTMPQSPHFLPLLECKEDYREGAAIGIMVTFSNLFEKIANLRIHDSRDSIETNLTSLSDLEKHGFDVTMLRDRVNKLLSIQEPLSKWSNVVMNAERELQQHADESQKLVATIEEIEKKMLALQQTLAATKTEMNAKEARAAVVRTLVNDMKGRIDNACNEFERVAAAPWS